MIRLSLALLLLLAGCATTGPEPMVQPACWAFDMDRVCQREAPASARSGWTLERCYCVRRGAELWTPLPADMLVNACTAPAAQP